VFGPAACPTEVQEAVRELPGTGLSDYLLKLAHDAVSEFCPRPPASQFVKGTDGIRVTSFWKAWPLFFPQHGPGSKLDRKIELVEWQQEIVDERPKAFIRGLVHSDGSRCLNTFTVRVA